MWIDLKCPAEIVSAEPPRKDEPWALLVLMNLSDRGIDSCEATVHLKNRDGEEVGRTVHRARALAGRPHSAFRMTVPMELPDGAVSAEASLDKVWFEDHDVWRRNQALEVEYEPNQLPPGNDLNALRYVAGPAAVGFPSQQANLWVCVCGRPNGAAETVCVRCRRQKDMIFQQYNRNAVLRQVSQRERQLDLQTRGAREETAQMQRVREEEYNRQQRRKQRRKRLAAALLAAAVLTAACVFGAVPGLRLLSADTALREDRLEDAREILTELGSFPGAEARLAETELRTARRDGTAAAEDAAAFSAEDMEKTAELLRARGEDADRELADRVDLSRARAMLNAGDVDGAETLAGSLPEALDGRGTLLADCVYARAEQAEEEHGYETAEELYRSLGAYRDAEEKARAARYERALALMEAEQYDEAALLLEEIRDYQDSAELIRKSHYLKGYTLEAQGRAEEARAAYLAAGDYEDAAEREAAIRWNQAEAYLAAEDYEHALPLYRELDGTEDARDKWITCATEMARAAYRQREYAIAASYLEDLPEDTRDTRQIRTRALYLGAKAAANRGELEEAIAMMERVADYSDAGKNLRTWRLELAGQRVSEGKPAEAREILEPIADNYNAQKLLKQIDAQLAAESAEDAGAQEASEGD